MLFQIGDWLVRQCTNGICNHHGIYLGPWWPHRYAVIHNDKNGGVRIVSFFEFAAGQPVYLKARCDWREREMVVLRALSLLRHPYGLIRFNCEDFVKYAHTGTTGSQQVMAAMLIGGLLFGILSRPGESGS